MVQRTGVPAHTSDRLSYLWLVLAAALFLVSTGDRVVWLAAWLAPLFLLRFVRTQRLLPGLLLAWLARSVVAFVTTRGIILIPGPAYYVIVLLADVPMRGVRTLNAAIGDLSAQLSVVGLVVVAGLAIVQGRKRPSAGRMPLPEPQPVR